MNNSKIMIGIRNNLKRSIDVKTKSTAQNYFKEQIKAYGVKTSIVTKISKESFKEIAGLKKNEMFSLGEELLTFGASSRDRFRLSRRILRYI